MDTLENLIVQSIELTHDLSRELLAIKEELSIKIDDQGARLEYLIRDLVKDLKGDVSSVLNAITDNFDNIHNELSDIRERLDRVNIKEF